MDKIELERYKNVLEKVQRNVKKNLISKMSQKELEEYEILIAQIKARLEMLEKLQ